MTLASQVQVGVHDCEYQHTEAEFCEMRELILDSYAASHKPVNWRLGLFENWNYTSSARRPRKYFTSRAQLWRNDSGELVGFLIRYYDTIHLQVRPDFRCVEDAMLQWAEENWFFYEGFVKVMAYDHDQERRRLLARRQYHDLGRASYLRIYDLSREYPHASIQAGFAITTQADHNDIAKRSMCERLVWGHPAIDEVLYRAKCTAPNYAPDWDLEVVTPDGEHAAFCVVIVDWCNRLAEIEPLGTHPKFRRQGFARALVLETIHRLQAYGIRYLYIQSDPDPDVPANRLYASLDPVETYIEHAWMNWSVYEHRDRNI